MIRTFAQGDVEELAEHADIPVINGLTDSSHPCQALADVMTIRERLGRLEGVRVAYFGDGNNVCASLMVACTRLGMSFVAATPKGYEPPPEVVALAREDGEVELTSEPHAAAEGADVLYTDVWTSMGQEEERARRLTRPRRLRDRRGARQRRRARGDRPPLPPGPLRRGDLRGRRVRAAVGCLGRSREPAARAKGAHGADHSLRRAPAPRQRPDPLVPARDGRADRHEFRRLVLGALRGPVRAARRRLLVLPRAR